MNGLQTLVREGLEDLDVRFRRQGFAVPVHNFQVGNPRVQAHQNASLEGPSPFGVVRLGGRRRRRRRRQGLEAPVETILNAVQRRVMSRHSGRCGKDGIQERFEQFEARRGQRRRGVVLGRHGIFGMIRGGGGGEVLPGKILQQPRQDDVGESLVGILLKDVVKEQKLQGRQLLHHSSLLLERRCVGGLLVGLLVMGLFGEQNVSTERRIGFVVAANNVNDGIEGFGGCNGGGWCFIVARRNRRPNRNGLTQTLMHWNQQSQRR